MFLPSAVTRKPGGGAAFAPNGLSFYNGGSGNNYLIKGSLTGVVDGPLGSLSIWCKINAGSGFDILVKSTTGTQLVFLDRASDNSLLMGVKSSGGLQHFITTAANVLTDTNWHHILASWDTNHSPASAKIGNLYLDDVDVKSGFVSDNAAFNINYTGEACVFNDNNTNTNIALSEVWYAPGQLIDFTDSAQRAKFSAGGHPISLGSDGSTPTGTAPAVYLHNAAATAGTNSGTGGNFTIQGTIADVTSP